MSILITGGLGFIGSHTVNELNKTDYDIIVIDNLSNSNNKMIDKLKKLCKRDRKHFWTSKLNSLDWISIQNFYDDSHCAVGRKYNVSDNAIRKWIKTYEKHNY
jgi:UDP-glucose 4-epimerase